jgi:hypothetical protein
MTTDNPQTYNQANEDLALIATYVKQLALARERLQNPSEAPFLQMADSMLTIVLTGDLIRNCWNFLYKYPFTTEFHPAISIVRSAELKPIEIQIADDLTPYLPTSVSLAAG